MNWRDATTYAYTQTLDAPQWAWEFLRRNKDYQRDYQWFMQTWRTLEQRYGKPPARDFNRWQKDPLAWRVSDSKSATGGEPLLIECWMGEKWGFYKFPLDPALCAPIALDKLAWRDRPTHATILAYDNHESYLSDDTRVALGFDLTMPLKPQFDDARKMLAILQRQLLKQAPEHACNVATQRDNWTLCLRILDACSNSANDRVDEHFLAEGIDISRMRKKAVKLCDHAYLDLLVIPEK